MSGYDIGVNSILYTYNMNNATLKTVDVEKDLGVITNNKNGNYSEQCLLAEKTSKLCSAYKL